MSSLARLKSPQRVSPERSAPVLALAGISALLASACCVIPLLLAVVGISGAWISQLRVLQPYSSGLIVLAGGALGLAGWRLYRNVPEEGEACHADGVACRTANATARRWFWLVALLTLIPLVVPLVAPWFY